MSDKLIKPEDLPKGAVVKTTDFKGNPVTCKFPGGGGTEIACMDINDPEGKKYVYVRHTERFINKGDYYECIS